MPKDVDPQKSTSALCTVKAEPRKSKATCRGGTDVFEIRDSWAPELGRKMAKVHKPPTRR